MLARVVVLAAVLLLTVAFGLWWASRQGRLHSARDPHAGDVGLDLLATAGFAPRAGTTTFVQFSAEVCTPCRHTARVLGDLARDRDDVRHVELDVEEHLDLVRTHGVLRTPTVLVIDGTGREVARASGAMTPRQAREALAAVPEGAS